MSGGVWILFVVPCPTPDGRSARELYEKRIVWISDAMRDDARARGCRFHRAWHAATLRTTQPRYAGAFIDMLASHGVLV